MQRHDDFVLRVDLHESTQYLPQSSPSVSVAYGWLDLVEILGDDLYPYTL